jgi:hypothetical protein
MFGKTTGLKALEIRKQLLLAESEVNRDELLKDFHTLKAAFKAETDRVKKQVIAAGSIASSAALIAAGFSLFRHRSKPEKSDGQSKMPWLVAALEGARTGASLFSKIKSFFHNRS